MAELLKNWGFMDGVFAVNGRVPVGSLDKWLDGNIWKLKRGTDFDCSCDSLRVRLRRSANRKGLRLVTRNISEDGSEFIIVQATSDLPVGGGENLGLDTEAVNRRYGISMVRYVHNWDEYLNGDIWKLVHGRDFDVSPESMRAQIYDEASRRGLQLRSRVVEDDGSKALVFVARKYIPEVNSTGENLGPDSTTVFPAMKPSRHNYSWNSWLNGQEWELVRGRDFHCQPSSFRNILRQKCAQVGMRCKISHKTRRGSDGDTIYFQALHR